MKKIILTVALLLTGAFSMAAEPQMISVNGVAERSIEPNMVILNLEIFGKALQAKQAQELQAKEYSRVKAIVEKHKIKKEDFSTENYSLNPEYTYDQKTQTNKVTGYRAQHQIKLTIRKSDSAGEMIDALTSTAKVDSSGVTVQTISWDSDQRQQAESQAMVDAVKVAQQKAETLAKAAGVKMKGIRLISHFSGTDGVVRPMQELRAMKSMAADYSGSTNVSGGQIKVRTEVQMQFDIN